MSATRSRSFELQPHLEGSLVKLRPLRPDDFDVLYAVARDPLIWEQHPASDRHEEAVFREFFADAIQSGGALVAIDAATDEVIGSSRYYGYDPDEREIEIGWTFLARSHWGGTHNAEIKRLMLEHAFRFVDRVVFLIGPNNIRSQRATAKIGATPAGRRTDGSGNESVVFQITASEFRSR